MPSPSESPRRWPFPAVCLAGLAGLAGLGALDIVTGEEISLSIFYLGPVAFVAWRGRPGAGLVFAVLGGAVWLGADMMAEHQHPYSHPLIPYWNASWGGCAWTWPSRRAWP